MESYEEAVLAERLGADRVELCSSLAVGGLTPDPALVRRISAALAIPVMVMVRPRAGDFVYGTAEVDRMRRAIDQVREAGAAGIVLGALTAAGGIDEESTASLAAYAAPLPVTFHKAIDELDDPVAGVRLLREIADVTRVLTSGGADTALDGVATLRKMLRVAHDRPTVMVAGRVTARNIDHIRELTGATEFHGRRIMGKLAG